MNKQVESFVKCRKLIASVLIWLCFVGVPSPYRITIIGFRQICEMRIVAVRLQRSLGLFKNTPNNTSTLDVRVTETSPSVELGKLMAESLSEGHQQLNRV